jgi:hypothetical protein
MSVDLHRRAEGLMGRAELIERADPDEARRLYLEAAELETEVFARIPASRPRTRGIIAVSAVSLYWRAGAQDEVERLAREYLACTEIPEYFRHQLAKLVANRDPARPGVAADGVTDASVRSGQLDPVGGDE